MLNLNTRREDIRYGYFREFGEIWWVADHVVNSVPVKELSLVIDVESDTEATLIKHGSKDAIQKYYTETVNKFKSAGYDEFADKLMMITLDNNFNLEEINKSIEITGYIINIVKAFKNGR